MVNIPDSNELFYSGIDPAKPYLRSPDVVERQLRQMLSEVVDVRARQLREESVDVEAKLKRLADDLQAIFYGKNPEFSVDGRWNRPEMLGYAITEICGLGGDRADAVERLGLRLINEFLDAYMRYEDDQIDDEGFQFECDALIETYVQILIGLPSS